MAARVAINGLGRIGRAALKIIMERPELELVAINDLVPPENLAYLLRYDTMYGRYGKPVEARDGALVVDGREIKTLNVKDPAELPWAEMEVELVFECTGIFTDEEGLKKHIFAGAKRAILSAPGKSTGILTVVPGVNSNEDRDYFSCASCTTNSIAPVVEIFGRYIGIKKAMMSTIHAYTSSQGIVDGPAKKYRRGRAAAANIVPTTTGAAEATTRVLPDYRNRFDGVALRVPVPLGSISDITVMAERNTDEKEVNDIFRQEAATERYREVLSISEEPLVSSDIIMDPHAAIVDATMTRVVDGDLVKIMAWYDNEWGYSSQMVREAVRLVS